MFYMLGRLRRRPGFVGTAFYTFFGGFAGSLFMIPLGIAMSRNSLRSVQDPNHLASALHDTMEQRRRGFVPKQQPLSDAPVSETAESSGWSDPAATSETSEPMFAPAASSDWSTLEPKSAGLNKKSTDAPPASRWDEIRGNRTSEPSKWEQIRQENAKNALPAHVNARQRSSQEHEQRQPLSDYDRAMNEYRAAFERERQGIDVTTGFTEHNEALRE